MLKNRHRERVWLNFAGLQQNVEVVVGSQNQSDLLGVFIKSNMLANVKCTISKQSGLRL
jgi:hypothetical protein